MVLSQESSLTKLIVQSKPFEYKVTTLYKTGMDEDHKTSVRFEVQKQVNNYNVLQSELTQLKPNAKVYRKEGNSDIFFLSSVDKELCSCKGTLDNLIKEHSDIEKSLPAT